ncbi:DUF1636 domain-containing protein [Palleronia sediminis]|uniref:DUF1636 domain-containing protein n=1 Tax=Palleronia sediminis TaxID=2547833 RepID=A0A4R6AD40_9RHOB|nr:DUF1636 family protein [Palleronia sediminis]TDL81097.1 DUF1636 domain-containing protein [Palleronia sediminis]
MDDTGTHVITICTSCRHGRRHCRPGLDLIRRLRAARDAASGVVGDGFEVEGFASLAVCDRPCTVAYRATADTVWLFGDVDPDADIDDLVAFADRGGLGGNPRAAGCAAALARVPSLVIRADRVTLQ